MSNEYLNVFRKFFDLFKRQKCSCGRPCAICKKCTGEGMAPEILHNGEWVAVCDDCGIEHAPEVMRVLRQIRGHE